MLVLGAIFGLVGLSQAHISAWHKGMYCLNGTTGQDNPNANDIVNPLFNLTKSEWWFHHINNCDLFPPAPGDFLDLPAGGDFTVELAANRAVTTLSYDGKFTTPWGDGKNHPDGYSMTNLGGYPASGGCLPSPNLHTTNESYAAGTAFAISYTNDLTQVTPNNLAVFTVLYHTPFKRLATYKVPRAMPACPPGGCICAWGWVPNGCGEPNMYMAGFRCRVTGAMSTVSVAPAKPPVWCEGNPSGCTRGAKQMVFWHQLDSNNIATTGSQADGLPKSPGYNMKLGFVNGPQNDIFIYRPGL